MANYSPHTPQLLSMQTRLFTYVVTDERGAFLDTLSLFPRAFFFTRACARMCERACGGVRVPAGACGCATACVRVCDGACPCANAFARVHVRAMKTLWRNPESNIVKQYG